MEDKNKQVAIDEMISRFGQWFAVVMLFIEKLLALNLTVEHVQELLKNKNHPFWLAFNEATKLLVPQPIVATQSGENSLLKPKNYLPTLDDCLILWPLFCKEYGLAIEMDFEALKTDPRVMGRDKGFDWLVYCPKGFTTHQAFELCRTLFTNVWEEIPVEGYSLERSMDKTNLILCRATVEPDKKWLGKSANDMSETTTPFLDARERYMLEAFYFWATKQLTGTGNHLDINGWTRCPRSRTSDGGVADASWADDGFRAYWCHAGNRDPDAGGREVVTLVT